MLFAAILLLLLPLMLFQHTVAATHAVCSWQPDRSPSNAGLVLHCTAEYIGDLPTSGHYECPKSKQVVATWSHIRAGILNFETPCGTGGWAFERGRCPEPVYAICVKGDCRYMASTDDCEIKGNFASSDLPSTVDVYQGSF